MKKLAKIRGGLVGVLVVLVLGFVLYVQLTHVRDFGTVPLPNISASQDPAVIARDAYITHAIAHCSACHGNGESTNNHGASFSQVLMGICVTTADTDTAIRMEMMWRWKKCVGA